MSVLSQSWTDKYIQIEAFLTQLFRMYNQDKFNNDENDELKWLFDVLSFKIG